MKFLTLPTALLTSILLVACNQNQAPSNAGNANTATTQTTETQPAETNTQVAPDPSLPTYTALTDVPYPPFEFKAEDGTVTGMEIEIFNAIAKDQGFNVQYAPHAWEGIFKSLNDNEPQFVISTVTMTDEAKENALLSEPYYFSPYRVVALDQTKLDTWNTLKVGISASEDSADDLPDRFNVSTGNIKSYPTVFFALSGMIRGEVDVVVADSTVLLYTMNGDAAKDFKDKFVSKTLDATDSSKLVFAIDKGHPELLEKVNAGLKKLKESGELDAILAKYGQTDASTHIAQ
ncbi:substrate-binding periplasmic protein [Moraxella equi]|uniref:Sulfate starvation-induced protein 7 n=1 Tax=Moraxella equi TaxID=60442 RepID=A0A378QNE5_9GAMM|nr:transporter substrate-binding domain-containing protein [Moraxella equi]OPH38619.1 hypothetical protein B5J93_05755 [Moraxella equi]STZ02397.1 Sulfate starvation-induced protein 7 [Moraxella equi]